MAVSHVYAGAGMWRGGNLSGAFRMTVGDDKWEQLTEGLPQPASVHCVTIHPRDPATIFVGTQDGLYISHDHGAHFQRPGFPDRNVQIWSVLVHPANPRIILAGAAPVAIYRSEDGGAHWQLLSRPVLPERVKMPFACRVMRLAIDANAPRDVFATIEVGGAMRSRDGGETWTDCTDGLVKLAETPRLKSNLVSGSDFEGMLDGHAVCVTSADPGAVFLACRMGIFRSGDGGDHWQDIDVGRFSALTYARDVRPAPQDPRTLYACLSVHATGDTGSLAVSHDVGQTWRRFDHGLNTKATLMNLALHPNDPAQVYGAGRNGQIIGTQDGGKSWRDYRLPAGCEDVYAVACG